jgi:hypothetical protein
MHGQQLVIDGVEECQARNQKLKENGRADRLERYRMIIGKAPVDLMSM